MSTPESDIQILDRFHREARFTEEFYLGQYNVNHPKQSGVEREWNIFLESILSLPTDRELLRAFRTLYADRVKHLLAPSTLSAHCSLSEQELDQLMLERRLLTADVRASAMNIGSIMLRSMDGVQKTLWEDGQRHAVRDMTDADIPTVKVIEAMQHDNAWKGTPFMEFYSKRARSKRLYDRYNRQSPLIAKVSTAGKGLITGYCIAAKITGERAYKSVHGVLTGLRRSLQVQTHGVREDGAQEATEAMFSTVIECAQRLECTRIEDCFEAFHPAKA